MGRPEPVNEFETAGRRNGCAVLDGHGGRRGEPEQLAGPLTLLGGEAASAQLLPAPPLRPADWQNAWADGLNQGSCRSPSGAARMPACSLRARGSYSPLSPCSPQRLRVAPSGSVRPLALRCARWPRHGTGDGQRDVSDGGSELGMVLA
jgi:hypothetical protein